MKEQLDKKQIIFLGAGASRADGCPLQSELFSEYFLKYQEEHKREPVGRILTYHEMDNKLVTFFYLFFGIDLDHQNLANVAFPTFEEVLGILELSLLRDESFREWTSQNIVSNSNQISHTRYLLIQLIADIIAKKLEGPNIYHTKLIQQLHRNGSLQNSAFISLNYDILIDNALTLFYNEVDVDYGIHFTDFDKAESLMYQDDNEIWKMPRKDRSIFLLKPHGSLNWLYCPTCLKVSLFPLEKKVSKLKWEPGECVCEKCKTLQVPILIPPTFFKVMSNYFLQQVWRLSEEKVLNADRIIFCGYSFPDADLHIKYLLKRAEINSDLLKEVYIVNEHKEKKNEERDLEKWRYQRFFHCGKTQVRYTDISFEEYANNPELILSPVRWK